MAELHFKPEQQATLRALLPAGADGIEIVVYGDTVEERERMSGIEWALRYLEHLAVSHREYVQKGRKNSFLVERDELACFEQRLAKLVPPPAIPSMVQQLYQLRKDAAALLVGYERMAAENKYPKNSHRELIFRHLLYIWTSLGGPLSVTHDPIEETSSGPLIMYFKCAASLVLGEPTLSVHTIAEIVRREVQWREGKWPRNRKRRQK